MVLPSMRLDDKIALVTGADRASGSRSPWLWPRPVRIASLPNCLRSCPA